MNNQKLALVQVLLTTDCPYLLLDSRHPAIVVPDDLRRADLILRIGYAGEMAMPDLHLDQDGFSCTIARQGRMDRVWVPWAVVQRAWLRPDGESNATLLLVWPDSIQATVAEPTPPPARGLRLVKS